MAKGASIGSTYEVVYVDPRNIDESFKETVYGVENMKVNGSVTMYNESGDILFATWHPVMVKLIDDGRVVH